MSEAKTCTRCGETKPIESFTRYKYKGEYKRKTVCAECLKAYTREWNKNNPDKIRERNQRAREKQTDEQRLAGNAYRLAWRRAKEEADPASREARLEWMRKYHQDRRSAEDGAEYLAKRNSSSAAWQRRGGEAYREGRRKYALEYYSRNAKSLRAYRKAYMERQENKEAMRGYLPAWRSRNRHKIATYSRRRRGREHLGALWGAEQAEAAYQQARELTEATGVVHHVDHVLPVINDLVCGLHVPGNLQVVPRSVNLEKSNKIPAGMVHLFAHVPEHMIYGG